MSPTGSEKNLNDDSTMSGLKVPGNNEHIHTLSVASFDIGNYYYYYFSPIRKKTKFFFCFKLKISFIR